MWGTADLGLLVGRVCWIDRVADLGLLVGRVVDLSTMATRGVRRSESMLGCSRDAGTKLS